MGKTILSAPIAISRALESSAEVTAITRTILPVGDLDIATPYIVFRREKLVEKPVKGVRGSDETVIELLCVSNDYEQSLELAEAVRDCLDGSSVDATEDTVRLRSCYLVDATEYREGNGYVQHLKFTVRI